MMSRIRMAAGLAALCSALPASAEMVMFSQRNFQGTSYALQAASNSLSFSPRSVRVLPGQAWELCPRPFFGGTCLKVSEADAKLSLPRGFSGMVRSARPAAEQPADAEAPAAEDTEPKP